MDSLVLNIVWIIATAFSRVCGISESVLAKTKINAIITILDHCNQHRSFIGLTTPIKNSKNTENSNITYFTSLQTHIPKICKKLKPSTNPKPSEKELIRHFNSVYQSKAPLLLIPNVLWRRVVSCMANITPDLKQILIKI